MNVCPFNLGVVNVCPFSHLVVILIYWYILYQSLISFDSGRLFHLRWIFPFTCIKILRFLIFGFVLSLLLLQLRMTRRCGTLSWKIMILRNSWCPRETMRVWWIIWWHCSRIWRHWRSREWILPECLQIWKIWIISFTKLLYISQSSEQIIALDK